MTVRTIDTFGIAVTLGPLTDAVAVASAEALAAVPRIWDRDHTVNVGIGPRYLHSTGQLHKGGNDRAAFLITVGDDPDDAEIPSKPYGFSRLKRAHAAGDHAALTEAGRRVAHIRLEDLPTA